MRMPVRILRQNVYEWASAPPAPAYQTPHDVELIPISGANVDRVLDFRGLAQVTQFHSFLKWGRVGVFAILDQRVIGHAWAYLCSGSPVVVNGYFVLRPGETLIHHCNVVPQYRGRGVYPAMISALSERILKENGSSRILIDTPYRNVSAVRGIEKAGFNFLAPAWFLKVGRRTILRRQLL
jgi:GNAT superfamily N-acetyltransferase